MKKIMLAAMAALAITGCSQNEEMDAPGKNAEINFSGIVKTSTRADLVTTNNIASFFVSGYKTIGEMSASTQLATAFINGAEVKKNGNNWESDTFYWPLTGKVQFFGTSPAQTLDITSPGHPKFDYTVGAIGDQIDLIAANLIDKDKTAGDLQLPFQHLLTQVNFSIKGDTPDFTYIVTKLEITGASNKGTFTFDGTATTGVWSGVKSETPAEYVFTGSKEVAPTTATPDLKTDFGETGKALFMLMPQDVSAVKVKVTYSAAPTASLTDLTFNSSKEITLTGTWDKGKNVRYTLTLSSDASPIKFEAPSVGDWTEDPKDIVTPKN